MQYDANRSEIYYMLYACAVGGAETVRGHLVSARSICPCAQPMSRAPLIGPIPRRDHRVKRAATRAFKDGSLNGAVGAFRALMRSANEDGGMSNPQFGVNLSALLTDRRWTRCDEASASSFCLAAGWGSDARGVRRGGASVTARVDRAGCRRRHDHHDHFHRSR